MATPVNTLLGDREKQEIWGEWWRQTGTKPTKRLEVSKWRDRNSKAVKPWPVCRAAETNSSLLHWRSCDLIHVHTMGTCKYSYPSLAQRPDHQPLPAIGTVVQGWAAYWRGWASEFVVAIETWPHPTIKASSVRNPLLIRDTDLVLFGIMSSKKRKRTGLDKSWINSYDRCDFTLNYPVCKMFGEGQGFCSTAMRLRNHK